MGMEKFHMYAQLYESQRRFQRACDQIAHLNGKLEDLHFRYKKAREARDKCFRYSLRMRIMAVEGMVKMYAQYACLKKNEVLDLRFKLYDECPDAGETMYRRLVDDDSEGESDGEGGQEGTDDV